jgi:hypothetical protein
MPIRLTKPAKALLRRNGKLKPRVAITYTPQDGEPNTRTRKLNLNIKK